LLFGTVLSELFLADMTTGLIFASIVSVVAPGIRSFATGVVLTTIHLLGDAISQPVVGGVSTLIENGTIPRSIVQMLATLLHSTPDQHLTIALVTVCAPAAVLAGILYIASVPAWRAFNSTP
jgi:hypothetical protein